MTVVCPYCGRNVYVDSDDPLEAMVALYVHELEWCHVKSTKIVA